MHPKIHIIAPSSKPKDPEALEKLDLLFKQQNLEYKIHPNILGDTEIPFYANNLEHRISDLKDAILDSNIDIIWAISGGYGASELINHIKDLTPSHAKMLIGFSDITALHNLFNHHFNIPSIHGEVFSRLYDNQEAMNKILSLYDKFKNNEPIEYGNLTPMNNDSANYIKGVVTGGNLALFSTSIGTIAHPNLKNMILMFEDIGERGYEIMRNLHHLQNVEIFDNVSAVIFGDFTEGKEADGKDYTYDAINFFVDKFLSHIPCFSIKNFGHGKVNDPIIFGAEAKIENNILKSVN